MSSSSGLSNSSSREEKHAAASAAKFYKDLHSLQQKLDEGGKVLQTLVRDTLEDLPQVNVSAKVCLEEHNAALQCFTSKPARQAFQCDELCVSTGF